MSEVRDVTTWHLEMRAVSQLRAARTPGVPHRIERVERPSAAFARFLYTAVGGHHQWFDRLPWSQARWDTHLRREAVHLYTLQLGGAPAGYFELEQQPQGDVQIIYFGLMPEHRGHGWGGALLTRAVQLAWQLGDALPNYQARGFEIFRQKTTPVELPPLAGPWPGWDDE